jgi:hypothetical protein
VFDPERDVLPIRMFAGQDKAHLRWKNLKGAPLGQVLALLVNLRLGWKVERTARDKHLNFLGPFINYKNINFITLILINI